ncbi:Colonization factor antigen I subunit E [Cedecea lapagei]|uniref:Colonization factor antigen I subunit E n=1 Tax=Cedecea lapagei TaxID=158823 RepID=A0A447V494_9ENTR|nr:CfaE/CblD family pilus tip adhesin [Cedecea lapagei]VEB99026.1 Colonization factor antigen I subunit E [Cedecea lapagei]
MNKSILILLFLTMGLCAGHTLAGAPAGRNTSVGISYDRAMPPARFDIWFHESGGYDSADPQKWGRNTLTCLSRTDSTYGACMDAPVWLSPPPPHSIPLRFTHMLSKKTVDINVYGEKHMFLKDNNFLYASYGTVGSSTASDWSREPYFDFYIVKSELAKLTTAGIWTATLKQNLRQWGGGPCGGNGNGNDLNIGCPSFGTLANWQANIRIEVVDPGNQQIYLPAFPHSTPIVNLNLTNFPGRPGGSEIKGKNTVDMCLFDGNNNTSTRAFLRFEDDGLAATGRTEGAFSIRRRGGSQTDARDRLDYQISVTNPITGATENVANGKTLVWQGANDPQYLRQVVLPGTRENVLCIPAPIILNTPAFASSSKNAGDYTGTLRVIYTPSTL